MAIRSDSVISTRGRHWNHVDKTSPFDSALLSLIFLLMFLTSHWAAAQSKGYYDTLTLAKQLINEKRIREANLILEASEKAHPNKVDVIRLRGQALYWSNDFDATLLYFRTAIKNNPNADVLKMDFGRILFEMNRLDEARRVLTDYRKSAQEDVEAEIILGTIAYWQGKRPGKAFRYLNPVLLKYPANRRTAELADEIHQATSPYIKISPGYYSDSQPLQTLNLAADAGFYQSSLLQPTLQVQARNLSIRAESVSHRAESVQLGNTFSFLKIKTVAITKAGVFKRSWTNGVFLTGGLELNQKLSKTITISGSLERSPYLYTVRSLSTGVMQTNYTASLGREAMNRWSGKAAYNLQQFKDHNQVKSFSIWFLMPVVKSFSLKVDLGYAFYIADSKRNAYVNDKSLSEITSRYYPGYTITGVYDPYFTPQNQQIHSVLGNLTFIPTRSLKFSIKSNTGLYALVDNPYFFLDYDKGHQLALYKGYHPLKYFPFEIRTAVSWALSKKIVLEGEYLYRKTVFFNSNSVSAGLKVNFWNEQKR
jgi:tetratricopeptide (TPR) repeat protein